MIPYAFLPLLSGRAGPQGAGPGKPRSDGLRANVIQELAAVRDSYHLEELPLTAFTVLPSLKSPHRFFSYRPPTFFFFFFFF